MQYKKDKQKNKEDTTSCPDTTPNQALHICQLMILILG
jgi:hypothetical protein